MTLEQYAKRLIVTGKEPHAFENSQLGMISEIGEIADIFKKDMEGRRPLHIDELILETGDLLFYLVWSIKYMWNTDFTADMKEAERLMFGDEYGHYYQIITKELENIKDLKLVLCCTSEQKTMRFISCIWIALVLNTFNLTLEEIMEKNIAKISNREGDPRGSGCVSEEEAGII